MTEQQLFALPPQAALVSPESTGVGAGPIKWASYTAKNPVKCDHCMRFAWESGRRQQVAPMARQARQKRTQGDSSLLLCNEHAQLLKQDEPSAAQKRRAA